MPPGHGENKLPWKQRLAREFVQYWINVIYLAAFFGVFEWYRRFILAEHGINYLHYGAAIVEALILGKIILIGDAIGLDRGFANKPLIYPTLYKAVVFTVFVAFFGVLEHIFESLLRHQGLAGGIERLLNKGKDEIFARCLVTFFAFIPFFSFRELARSLGRGKLGSLFFRKRPALGDG